jgi:hypothetical protein
MEEAFNDSVKDESTTANEVLAPNVDLKIAGVEHEPLVLFAPTPNMKAQQSQRPTKNWNLELMNYNNRKLVLEDQVKKVSFAPTLTMTQKLSQQSRRRTQNWAFEIMDYNKKKSMMKRSRKSRRSTKNWEIELMAYHNNKSDDSHNSDDCSDNDDINCAAILVPLI